MRHHCIELHQAVATSDGMAEEQTKELCPFICPGRWRTQRVTCSRGIKWEDHMHTNWNNFHWLLRGGKERISKYVYICELIYVSTVQRKWISTRYMLSGVPLRCTQRLTKLKAHYMYNSICPINLFHLLKQYVQWSEQTISEGKAILSASLLPITQSISCFFSSKGLLGHN